MKLPGALRLLWRLPAFFIWTSALALYWHFKAPFLNPSQQARGSGKVMQYWAKGMLRILSIRIKVEGLPPPSPFLLAANHLGYLDIVLLAAIAPQGFVAKQEMAGWPILGPMAKGMGTLFLNRSNIRDTLRVGRELEWRLQRGASTALFLEGTSSHGDRILPFHAALLESSARQGRKVYAAHLRYLCPEVDVGEKVCWHGEMEFLPHLFHLFTLPRIEAEIRLDPEPSFVGNRRELAAALWQKVERLRQRAFREWTAEEKMLVRLQSHPQEQHCA